VAALPSADYCRGANINNVFHLQSQSDGTGLNAIVNLPMQPLVEIDHDTVSFIITVEVTNETSLSNEIQQATGELLPVVNLNWHLRRGPRSWRYKLK
jgi:hypothetical protein